MKTLAGFVAMLTVLIGLAVSVAADERADWGVVVSVGVENQTLLVRNDRGIHLVAVDPLGAIRRPGRSRGVLAELAPGDRIDYAVSSWVGMEVVDLIDVTPRRHAQTTHP